MRPHLGLPTHDGPNDWPKPWLRFPKVSVLSLYFNRSLFQYSFVELSAARKCVEMYDRFEIRNKRELHVTISQPNNRLFVGSIPKTKTKRKPTFFTHSLIRFSEEILDEFSKHTNGLTDVILYYQVEEKNKGSGLQKNRGFCFLEYETHQAASQARRRLLSGRTYDNPKKKTNASVKNISFLIKYMI